MLGELSEGHHESEEEDGDEDRIDAPVLLLELCPELLIEGLAHAVSIHLMTASGKAG